MGLHYYRSSKPSRCSACGQRILDAVDRLEDFAELGAPLSSITKAGAGYRFLVSGNYMVFYRVRGNDVFIDRILYGRSNYMNLLFKDNESVKG